MKIMEYLRDGRAPIPKSVTTSKVMSANKGKDTKPELHFRKTLRDLGLTGYRLHWKTVSGKPDITFVGKKVAIFIHGCFWHRCPYCDLPLPRSNTEFWKNKFKRNKDRDDRKEKELIENGWKVFTFWECQIKKDAEKFALIVKEYLDRERNKVYDNTAL